MLTYLLIFLAVCMIVGPALVLIPSRRQREQMDLRARARKAGLQVELATVDDPDPDPAKYRTLSGKALPRVIRCVALRTSRRRELNWREQKPVAWQVVRTASSTGAGLPANWRWASGEPERLSQALRALLGSALEELPHDVLAVGEQQLLVSVYWQERSGVQGLEQIQAVLSRLASVPLADPEEEDAEG